MMKQTNLFGNILNPTVGRGRNKEKYDCVQSCYNAKPNSKCTCRCRGLYHGMGRVKINRLEELNGERKLETNLDRRRTKNIASE